MQSSDVSDANYGRRRKLRSCENLQIQTFMSQSDAPRFTFHLSIQI